MSTSENKIINCERGFVATKPAAQPEYSYTPKEGCCKLSVYDWLHDLPSINTNDIFEVRFKNTHKGFFRNVNNLALAKGDIIAVESATGHDIGIVSCVGPLVKLQMKRHKIKDNYEFKKIYRQAKPADVEKWQEAIGREHQVMIKSRQIAARLKLNMKIGDVEFQGDGTKAIFYYIADERVDFRELIKVLADEFRIRIEMRQIGARQEAGLIGGIGVCGRELCCAQWIAEFMSVNTSSARVQELSLNPQKLAGQCSKLKCCLNYEMAAYVDAQKDFPTVKNPLDTVDGLAYWQKTDVMKRLMWFSYDQRTAVNLIAVPVDKVKEIIELNRQGKKAEALMEHKGERGGGISAAAPDFISSAGEDSITRFDKKKKSNNKRPNRGRGNERRDERRAQPQGERAQGQPQQKPQEQGQQQQRPQGQQQSQDRGPRPPRNNQHRNNNRDRRNNNNPNANKGGSGNEAK